MPKSGIPFDQLSDEAYVRQPGVLTVYPVSAATLWRRVSRGEFPQPTKLGERITAWRVGDVRRYLADPKGVKTQLAAAEPRLTPQASGCDPHRKAPSGAKKEAPALESGRRSPRR